MTDEIFNLILKVATFDGDACYNNSEEMKNDYAINHFISLTPEEVQRIIFTAYEFGKNNIGVEE